MPHPGRSLTTRDTRSRCEDASTSTPGDFASPSVEVPAEHLETVFEDERRRERRIDSLRIRRTPGLRAREDIPGKNTKTRVNTGYTYSIRYLLSEENKRPCC